MEHDQKVAVLIQNLHKNYSGNMALRGLNLEIYDGEIHGLLGPNGAGKSTTMKILAGITAPTSGEIFLWGKNPYANPNDRSNLIGYLPENPPLYLDMRVKDFLLFNLRIHCNQALAQTLAKKQQQYDVVAAALEKLQITDIAKRLIGNLSKGYRQRVALAALLVFSPKLLILDEPTVGLDPLSLIEIRNIIKSLAKEHTIIFTSHQLAEVSSICSAITIIHHGRAVWKTELKGEGMPTNLEQKFLEVIHAENASTSN
ncbi:MAG: ABC transporter ATP-binding protein [Oligoflexia bacterium]|nr:ABC transporter ATP-binding protein [Oligoflexia bacterium]